MADHSVFIDFLISFSKDPISSRKEFGIVNLLVNVLVEFFISKMTYGELLYEIPNSLRELIRSLEKESRKLTKLMYFFFSKVLHYYTYRTDHKVFIARKYVVARRDFLIFCTILCFQVCYIK